jgi:HSP20 family protein
VDPFREIFELQRGLERAYAWPQEEQVAETESRAFPPVNVFRNRDGYLVRLEVPGVDAQNIEVEAAGRGLRITGKRAPESVSGESQHRLERWSGEFSRAIQLPNDADLDAIEAKCKNGVLTIQIYQLATCKPRQIEVKAE